jgi:hypothetical protein
LSDSGLPGVPAEGRRHRGVGRAWRRALVYFGLAEDDPVNPLFPRHAATGSPATGEPEVLAEILRKLDEQAVAMAELRAEVERLRELPRPGRRPEAL